MRQCLQPNKSVKIAYQASNIIFLSLPALFPFPPTTSHTLLLLSYLNLIIENFLKSSRCDAPASGDPPTLRLSSSNRSVQVPSFLHMYLKILCLFPFLSYLKTNSIDLNQIPMENYFQICRAFNLLPLPFSITPSPYKARNSKFVIPF